MTNEKLPPIKVNMSVLIAAIIFSAIMALIFLGGAVLELLAGGQDWRQILNLISSGLPFAICLAVCTSYRTRFVTRWFSGENGRRLTFLLLGAYFIFRLVLWYIFI